MLPASSRTSSNPYSAFPTAQFASVPVSAANQANPDTIVQAPDPLVPVFRWSEATTKPFDDFYQNGMVPEDKFVQASIARAYLENNDVDELNEFLEKGNIKSLDLKGRLLDCRNAEVLANVIKINKTLIEINLANNKIGAEGLKFIFAAMEENSTLIALDVGFNDFEGSLHVNAIGKMIANNKTLEILNLAVSNIGEEGMLILAEALKENHTLTELNLDSNFCGSRGIEALLEMLKKIRLLKFLTCLAI